jgi:hypothetical protein
MIYEIIEQQVQGLRRSLAGVVLSTLPRRDSPALLLLHWHGFALEERRHGSAPSAVPLPTSALQLSPRWRQLEELDQAVLEAAWQLGAWDLVREERRGCNVVGASAREAAACRQAFGDNPFDPDDDAHLVAEAPDRSDLVVDAARLGYVSWRFRPVAHGLWRHAGADDSLQHDGSRLPPCPVAPAAPVGPRVVRKTYQLGRIDRIVLL